MTCLLASARSESCAGEISTDDSRWQEQLIYTRGRLELGLESAYVFIIVPNPFFGLAGSYNKSPIHYKLSTQVLSLRYHLTNPSGPSFLRGNWEISGLAVGSVIVDGAESYFAGLGAGLRYYFVQPGARLVPFVEVRGAAGFTDSRGYHYAQQQDFTFSYMLGAGLRYDLNRRVSLTAAAIDQHLSNAYITRPNYGFDSVGLSLGALLRF
jgi:Lipid A 3-O-deacylase (PagL)